MTILNNLLSPISIAFIVIIVGYYIGRIKLFKVSLDLSGVLIVAVFVGWLLALITSKYAIVGIDEYSTYMKMFSALGTALFVSSMGISTGVILDFHKKKDMKAILIGSLMVVSSFAIMRIISVVDNNISISRLIGSLCGALTTTPGLSTACELNNVISEEITLGYGYAYPFGVLITVLFVQVIAKKSKLTSENEKPLYNDCGNSAALGGLIQIGSVIILGRLIGNIEFLNFSLGNTGGMLFAGIVIGLIVKKYFSEKALTSKEIAPFRSMGLVLFFVGNGIPAGMRIFGGFDVKLILYGVLMTIVPIIFGVILHKLFFDEGLAATTIAGGMTSTPAIGILVEKHNSIALGRYALAYFGALMTIIILIRFQDFCSII